MFHGLQTGHRRLCLCVSSAGRVWCRHSLSKSHYPVCVRVRVRVCVRVYVCVHVRMRVRVCVGVGEVNMNLRGQYVHM